MRPEKSIEVRSAKELRDWLTANHDLKDSFWLITYKKQSNFPYLSYNDIVDELICFGWVDSMPKKLDVQRTMRRISPKASESNWSGVNKRRVKKLTASGKMMPPGIAKVKIAKENGSWNFLDEVEQLIIPYDLEAALNSQPQAYYFFNRFPKSSKRNILEWIKSAKKETTRCKRISETALKASKNLKANHPSGRDAGPSYSNA
ncbi:YdeI/OmpD-associated family protein [Galbibacter sp. BG1]|uniref:YdeI/OmpD-associated family protein n=1 Tax=Galbibacter sp. BG1 TaxID=1170699 RepID=UPI0015BEEAB1|nr:YdeI/OmpD-associated family protein [Galbibacter sp. BG1]QLE01843.1 YdeI/OmpD-associated family protein [Galbibacter sp. BG1]